MTNDKAFATQDDRPAERNTIDFIDPYVTHMNNIEATLLGVWFYGFIARIGWSGASTPQLDEIASLICNLTISWCEGTQIWRHVLIF